MLHRSGLVISDANGQGRQLRRRGDQKKKRELLGKLANIFALALSRIRSENCSAHSTISLGGCLRL